jgi:hypothetical protein
MNIQVAPLPVKACGKLSSSVTVLDRRRPFMYSRDMSTTATSKRPGFRKPRTHGAKAYAEADTLADLVQGFKRARKIQLAHMPLEGKRNGVDKLPCACCGVALAAKYAVNPGEEPSRVDQRATVKYDPRTKRVVLMHYYCSWGDLMNQVFKLGRALQLR